ncbi:MAG: DUF2306 domain-containing protein [Rhodothermales bacterium]
MPFAGDQMPKLVATLLSRNPVPALAHFLGGALVLALGAFQFNGGLRRRYPAMHRWSGRLYVAGILAGGIGALAMVPRAMGGLPAQAGFGILGLIWLGTTGAGFLHIRRGNLMAHRTWMLRSYALTFAAVTLRIYLPLMVSAGVPFETAYAAVAWLCWLPNLLVAEWIIRRSVPAEPIIRPSVS